MKPHTMDQIRTLATWATQSTCLMVLKIIFDLLPSCTPSKTGELYVTMLVMLLGISREPQDSGLLHLLKPNKQILQSSIQSKLLTRLLISRFKLRLR